MTQDFYDLVIARRALAVNLTVSETRDEKKNEERKRSKATLIDWTLSEMSKPPCMSG